MSLIDSSYFVTGEYEIANIVGAAEVVTTNVAKLTTFITKYEPEYIQALLGITLYDEFIAGLAVTPTPEAKWTDLKNKTNSKLDFILKGYDRKYLQAQLERFDANPLSRSRY